MQTSQEITNMPEAKDYSIVRLNAGNIRDLCLLHQAVYGSVDDDYYRKKYDTSYTGIQFVGYLAYNNSGLAIAYYGVLPCFIRFGEKTILAAQSADTMTHPGHRFKGMFVELSHKTFGLCQELGIRMVFGFPNQNSYHGAVHKLGWKLLHHMNSFSIPVNTLPLETLSHKLTSAGPLYARYRESTLRSKTADAAGIPNSVVLEGYAGVDRSAAYLQYKTYSPTRVIRIGHSKVWISNRSGMIIGDMEPAAEESFPIIIKGLRKIAVRMGVRMIQFHCSPETRLHALFSSLTKPGPSFPALIQDFGMEIPPERIRFTFSDIDIF